MSNFTKYESFLESKTKHRYYLHATSGEYIDGIEKNGLIPKRITISKHFPKDLKIYLDSVYDKKAKIFAKLIEKEELDVYDISNLENVAFPVYGLFDNLDDEEFEEILLKSKKELQFDKKIAEYKNMKYSEESVQSLVLELEALINKKIYQLTDHDIYFIIIDNNIAKVKWTKDNAGDEDSYFTEEKIPAEALTIIKGSDDIIKDLESFLESKTNTHKIKILELPKSSSIPAKILLQKLCLLRKAEKVGDIETVNNTQLSRLNYQGVKYEKIEESKNKNFFTGKMEDDATFFPEGTMAKSTKEIVRVASSKRYAPKGLGSAIQYLTYYLNRAGKGLDKDQRERIESAREILQKKNQEQKANESKEENCKIEIECTPSAKDNLMKILGELKRLGDIGCTRDITIEDFDQVKGLQFDGDGPDKIISFKEM